MGARRKEQTALLSEYCDRYRNKYLLNQFALTGSFFLSRQCVTILLDGSSDAILRVKTNIG